MARAPTFVDGHGRLYVSNQLSDADDPGYVRDSTTMTVLLPGGSSSSVLVQDFPELSEVIELTHYADNRYVGQFRVIETYLRAREQRLHKHTIGVRLVSASSGLFF